MRRLWTFALLAALAACADLGGPTAPKYPVFFGGWSASLDDSAQSVVAQAAQDAKAQPATVVTVQGYSDPVGAPDDNIAVSRARAQTVADTLARDGVPQARIRVVAHGSVPFVFDSQESRRVVISLDTP